MAAAMFVLNMETWGDFDIRQTTPIAVSESRERLEAEAARLNAARKPSRFVFGEWKDEYVVSREKVKVL